MKDDGARRSDWRAGALQEVATTLLTGEAGWRTALAEAVAPGPHDVVLEGGCGAGGLTQLLARMAPEADYVGMDPDETLVAQARSRLFHRRCSLSFIVADVADAALHLGAWTPTRVILNFVRETPSGARLAQLHGVRQIIDPAGMLYVASTRAAPTPMLQSVLAFVRGGPDLNGDQETAALIRAAGFVAVEEFAVRAGPAGSVSLYRARAS